MSNQDSRARRSATETKARASRAAADFPRTENDGTAMTAAQRRALIRSEFVQEALPSAPPIPGFHLCWLSSTSSYDPISKRMRLGYTPVQQSELPGFKPGAMTSGEFEGCVSCNEMVLFKIPEETYQAIMREFHHEMPMEEEEALKSQLLRDDEDSNGNKLGAIEGDGLANIVNRRANPLFA